MARTPGSPVGPAWLAPGLPLVALGAAWLLTGAGDPDIPLVERQADGGFLVRVDRPAGEFFRLDRSDGLGGWQAVATLRSPATGATDYLDTGAPYAAQRFYRAVPLDEAPALTGDHLQTEAGDVVIHPVYHATVVLSWDGKTIYIDPDSLPGGHNGYAGLPKADLVLVTHTHGDHFDQGAINAQRQATPVIIAPQAVSDMMAATLRGFTTVLANGENTDLLGLNVEAVPAYNGNHPRGAGNGYVLTIGGKRLFFTGDTGDIPEIRALTGIDVAFFCMNLPFTMSGPAAAGSVRDFAPRVVYPYHFRNQNGSFTDLAAFKATVGIDRGVEVRERDWY